jgi:hypothetical protein
MTKYIKLIKEFIGVKDAIILPISKTDKKGGYLSVTVWTEDGIMTFGIYKNKVETSAMTEPRPYNPDEVILAVDSHYGIYTPQTYVERYNPVNADREDLRILKAGPDQEWYWESWESIMNCPVVINDKTYIPFQNEDVWLIPADMLFPELI